LNNDAGAQDVSLAEVLAALSIATDLAKGQPPLENHFFDFSISR